MPAVSPPDLQQERTLAVTAGAGIAGIDEVGRGAWAGPVVAAAVMLPLERSDLGHRLAGVRDSKQLTPQRRAAAEREVRAVAQAVGLGQAEAAEIDSLGIVPATRLAMVRAIGSLALSPSGLVIDAVHLPELDLPQAALFHADALCLSVAAASIVAKVYRDRLMSDLDAQYPGYEHSRHKGYGTARHRAALARLGPSPIHRRSFAPIRALSQFSEFLELLQFLFPGVPTCASR